MDLHQRQGRVPITSRLPIRGRRHILHPASPAGVTTRQPATRPGMCTAMYHWEDAAQAHRTVERSDIPGEVALVVDDELAATLEI